MLNKKDFLERLKFIKNYLDKMNKFDLALKDFAKSDFTGFYDTYLTTKLVQFLAQDMGDKDDWIDWWIWETDWGKKKEICRIWESGADDDSEPDYIVETPEQLYDFLVINYIEPISNETLDMVLKAQDNGVKFALKEIDDLKNKNARTKNTEWKEREAFIKLIQNKIKDQYLYQRGTNADIDFTKNLTIITSLDKE